MIMNRIKIARRLTRIARRLIGFEAFFPEVRFQSAQMRKFVFETEFKVGSHYVPEIPDDASSQRMMKNKLDREMRSLADKIKREAQPILKSHDLNIRNVETKTDFDPRMDVDIPYYIEIQVDRVPRDLHQVAEELRSIQ